MEVFGEKFAKQKYKPSNPTKKILFIGGSNRGKTMHMINYFIHVIKKCCGVVIVAPEQSHQDEKKLKLKEWCEEAGMPIYFCTEHNFDAVPKFPSDSVYIVDDFYTSTDRNGAIERLVKHMVNVGRHYGIHILYAAHLDINLPSEIKYNCSNIFLNAQFAIKPETYDHLQIRDASKSKEIKDAYEWFIYDDTHLKEGRLIDVVWPVIGSRTNLIDKIKNKIPKIHKKELETISKEPQKIKQTETNICDMLSGKLYVKPKYY